MEKVNLLEKFKQFDEHWSPKIAGELNGQQVKLVKFKGPFVWHHHAYEDELLWNCLTGALNCMKEISLLYQRVLSTGPMLQKKYG